MNSKKILIALVFVTTFSSAAIASGPQITPSTNQIVDNGEFVKITGSVSGAKWEEIKIWEKSEGESYFNVEKSEECDKWDCSISMSFSDRNTHSRFFIEAETDSSSSKTNKIRVTWREKSQAPTARFDWTPNTPKESESVEFDASRSSDDGRIVEYKWDLGDGYTRFGRKITHSFEESGSYPVELTVEDEDGHTDTETKYIYVEEDSRDVRCGITKDSVNFRLKDYSLENGKSTQAVVELSNSASRNQDVNVKFKVNQNVVGTRDVTVYSGSSRKISKTVSPNKDSFIRAIVTTQGEPCGSKKYSFYKELVVYSDVEKEASLDVSVTDEDSNPIEDVRVEVNGPEDRVRYTDSNGEAGFGLKPGRYNIEASHPDYGSEEKTLRLYEGENKQLEFELSKDGDGQGSLRITVKNREGDWIKDARVEVDGAEDRVKYTGDFGVAQFDLRTGEYDVEISHPSYQDTASRTVNIQEGETTSRTIRLYQEETQGIEITDVHYPSSVCRGSTLSVDVTVSNKANRDEYVTVTGSGLGSVNVLKGFSLNQGAERTRTVRFTNVQGSGSEDFKIVARNGTDDAVSKTVNVQNCNIATPGHEATSVSMKLAYPVAPNRALVGDTVKVSGFVDGVTGRTEVTINVNGRRKAQVSTQPDGYYQTFIRMDSPGTKTVTARSSGASASREIQVLPTAKVTSIKAPRKVFQGETFEICAEISSQIQAGVFLYEDERMIQKVNTRGEKCFEVTAQDPGVHVYKVRAATPGESSSAKVSVEVLETDVEITSFPDQVASIESSSGMVKVELYNTHNQSKRYNLELKGLPSTWVSQSKKEVVLGMGERRTVYFYLTPREEGEYDPTVVVKADNDEVYRQKVDLSTGGQIRQQEKGVMEKLSSFFNF